MRASKTLLFIIMVMLVTGWFTGISFGEDNAKKGTLILLATDIDRNIPPSDFEKAIIVLENRLKEIGDLFPGAEGYPVKIDLQQQQMMIWLSETSTREDLLRFLLRTGKLNFRVDGAIVMEGADLKSAGAVLWPDNRPIIEFEFGAEGANQLEGITTANIGKKIGIYLDDELMMEAVVTDPLHDGRGIIAIGSKGMEDAKRIAFLMRTGFLPVGLRIVQEITGVPYPEIY